MFSKPILACIALAAFGLVSVSGDHDSDKIIIMPPRPHHKPHYMPIPIFYPTYGHQSYGHQSYGHQSYGGGDQGYGGHGGYDMHSMGSMGGYGGGYDMSHMMGGMGGY